MQTNGRVSIRPKRRPQPRVRTPCTGRFSSGLSHDEEERLDERHRREVLDAENDAFFAMVPALEDGGSDVAMSLVYEPPAARFFSETFFGTCPRIAGEEE